MNESEVDSSNVVIVDVGYLTKRDDIAKLLLQIDSMHPKRMGVDILFSDYYNTREDSILWRAVNAIKNNEELHFTAGDQTRQYVHVSEVPRLLEIAYEKKLSHVKYSSKRSDFLRFYA